MRPTPALFDIAKRGAAPDERTVPHPTDGPASARAARPRLLRPTSRAVLAFPWPAALRLFQRRRQVKPASTSTTANFRSSVKGPLRRFYIFTQLNYVGNEVPLHVRHRGDGQPLVLHGHSWMHTTWRGVRPHRAGPFFVVCLHLRGSAVYASPDAPEHARSSKRARTGCHLVTAACG